MRNVNLNRIIIYDELDLENIDKRIQVHVN